MTASHESRHNTPDLTRNAPAGLINPDIRVRRQSSSGAEKVWGVTRSVAGYEVTSWTRTPPGLWTVSATSSGYPNWNAALLVDDDAVTLRPQEITDYRVGPDIVAEDLLTLLRCEGSGNTEDIDWGDCDIMSWTDTEDEIRDLFADSDTVVRWVSVDGARLVFLADRSGALVPLLVSDGEAIVRDGIASYSWSDEISMTSGAGSISLLAIDEMHGVTWPSGDDIGETKVELIDLPDDPAALARAIGAWLESVEYYRLGPFHAAAILLEPLDPKNQLAETERLEWQGAIDSLEFSLTVWVDGPTLGALRTHLGERNHSYRAIRDGLTDPTGESGRSLFQIMTEGELRTDI